MPAQASPSPWSPFRQRMFALLWLAAVASNIGTWMHDVGAGWLMTSLSPSPLTVALVQTATTLPIFLFALPAGALADIVDRRKLLLFFQIMMLSLAAALALLVWLDRVTPSALLLFTFLMGACAAFSVPAWQAIVPKLVPRNILPQAVALNSLGVNISRAIGPALAGFIIVGLGLAAPFAFNALSFLGVIAVLWRWRPPAAPRANLPAERLWAAMATGLRYARGSAPLKATLLRAVAFFLFASAFWALLPLVVKHQLGGGASLYGGLLAAIGVGAVAGAFALPLVKARLGSDGAVAAGSVLIAGVMLLNAAASHPAAAAISCVLFGGGWITVLSTLNVSAQMAVPDWVRARGLSIYMMAFFGAMSAGSALWGQVAALASLAVALAAAGMAMLMAILLTWRVRLQFGDEIDIAPSAHWPAPVVAGDVRIDRGPVMTTIEYTVAPQDAAAFLRQAALLENARRRLGAYDWGILQDAAEPGRFVEYFMEPSWLDHLRHHERVSGEDKVVQARVNAFHLGDGPPRVRHLIGPDADRHQPAA